MLLLEISNGLEKKKSLSSKSVYGHLLFSFLPSYTSYANLIFKGSDDINIKSDLCKELHIFNLVWIFPPPPWEDFCTGFQENSQTPVSHISLSINLWKSTQHAAKNVLYFFDFAVTVLELGGEKHFSDFISILINKQVYLIALFFS